MTADVHVRRGEIVRFEHVGCAYGASTVIEDVTFDVTEGEFVGIVGPSGGGKTTVLRALLGTLDLTYGTIVRNASLRLGYVPQVEAVDWSFPVTVRDVVQMTIARPRFGRLARRDAVRVSNVLDRLG